MSISMFDLPLGAPTYTFVDDATGEATHIASGLLAAALEAANWRIERAEIGDTLVDALKRGDLGVEEEHALKLPDAALETPVIVCQWGDTHVIADGNHRVWRRWKRGDRDLIVRHVPEGVWRLFVIDDVPGDGALWDAFNRNAKVRT